ncbi:hypothetical protein EYF80_016968 [Liparis tanakae]|uniref:Uncharacterized protein n=1 Tax=Liparis tanakae TaxID=230148 RepID=A0A4Z2I4D3_9TELE|nr:hypothetical protein EYF80_016968 [Liparis tanakae]
MAAAAPREADAAFSDTLCVLSTGGLSDYGKENGEMRDCGSFQSRSENHKDSHPGELARRAATERESIKSGIGVCSEGFGSSPMMQSHRFSTRLGIHLSSLERSHWLMPILPSPRPIIKTGLEGKGGGASATSSAALTTHTHTHTHTHTQISGGWHTSVSLSLIHSAIVYGIHRGYVL